jgi:hypothetical protein
LSFQLILGKATSVLPPLSLEFEATVWLGSDPHDVDIIEQIAILRIRHFLLTATCVQEVTHPNFFFVIRRLEQRLEFVRLVWLDFLFFVTQLPKDLASEKEGIGTQECIAGLEDVVDVAGVKQSVPGGLAAVGERIRKATDRRPV